jgi:tetratricopeptide (TPR) repeat protein
VFFNFDWAPVTGVFWLLAGALWSSAASFRDEGVSVSEPAAVGWSVPSALWRPALAVALVAVAVLLAVLPVMAEVWSYRGRADLAVRVDPLQAQYHWWFGDSLVATGDVAGGIAELRRASDLGETEPAMYVDLGDTEVRVGDRAAARHAFERALQIDPYYTPAQESLAGTGP